MNGQLTEIDLSVRLGRLPLANPIMVASGTFGYAREMEHLVDLSRLGGILPKTVTMEPRAGNKPWRTVETAAGLLNSIGLDNDGIDAFIAHHLPYLRQLPAPVIVSIAGRSPDEYVRMAGQLETAGGVAALELNISCPNVTGGVDYGTDPDLCQDLVGRVRSSCLGQTAAAYRAGARGMGGSRQAICHQWEGTQGADCAS